jgi:uncharacterized protein HemX
MGNLLAAMTQVTQQPQPSAEHLYGCLLSLVVAAVSSAISLWLWHRSREEQREVQALQQELHEWCAALAKENAELRLQLAMYEHAQREPLTINNH